MTSESIIVTTVHGSNNDIVLGSVLGAVLSILFLTLGLIVIIATIGPNSATCTDKGQWRLDPSRPLCTKSKGYIFTQIPNKQCCGIDWSVIYHWPRQVYV